MIPTKRKEKILQYVRRVGTNSDPVSIHASLTDYCFNQCYMCGHWERKNKTVMSKEVWLNFLSNHVDIESVCYAGGDPMTIPYLNELMEFHIKNDIAFGFQTCGYVPYNIRKELIKKARWFRCSLDAVDEDIYQAQRGKIELNKVINSILQMKNSGINVELSITVTEINKDHIPEIIDFAIEHNIGGDIHPNYGSTIDLFDDDNISHKIIEANEKGILITPYHHKQIKEQDCLVTYYQIYIDSKGDIYPCCTCAGDTEIRPRTNCLGSVFNWGAFLKNRAKFKGHLDCCKYCIERFGWINSIAGNIEIKNNFF